MPNKPNLQPIIDLTASMTQQHYADQVTALQCTIPDQLHQLIAVSEEIAFSRRMSSVIGDAVIANHKDMLNQITALNECGDYSRAGDIISRFKCDLEMTRLFFEGINLYLVNTYHTIFA